MADVSIGANAGVADLDSFLSCSCEAVGCDGLCQGPYVWWFGIKFVVTVGIYRDMRDYYEHIIPSRRAAAMNYAEHGP